MRTFVATLLALAACLVLPVAVLAAWLGTVVDDTDRYVATVGPLATDAQVVDAVEQTLTDRTLSAVEENVPFDAGSADLRPVVASGVRAVVTSREFRPAWEAANAEAHRQLLAQLRGTGRDDGSDVVLDLGPVADSVVARVGDELPVQVTLPRVSVPVSVLQGGQVQQAREVYDVLDTARVYAPATWLVLAVLALLLSARRGGTLVLLGVGSLVTLGLLLVMLAFARDRIVSAVTEQELSGAVWDGVTSSLDLLVYACAGLAVVLALVGGVASIASRRRA